MSLENNRMDGEVYDVLEKQKPFPMDSQVLDLSFLYFGYVEYLLISLFKGKYGSISMYHKSFSEAKR